MKVNKLNKKQLNHWAAKAQDWTIKLNEEPYPYDVPNEWVPVNGETLWVDEYKPSTDMAQAMELMIEFRKDLKVLYLGKSGNSYTFVLGNELIISDKTLMEAICRAVITSVYGEEVPNEL